MKIVIMAGGKGTRIASVASDIPKPMIPVCEKPILEHEIMCLRDQGLTDIILVVGHLGHIITDYFGDGKEWGVSIEYIVEDSPLGTAGALFYLKDKIEDDFLLLNGDIIFDVDFMRFLDFHKKHKGMATILTHPNNHPYDSGIIMTNKDNVVLNWLHKEDERDYYKNRVNAGIHILSPEIFTLFKELKKVDLDRDILKPLIQYQKLIAYDSPEYVKDMGTPERYEMVIRDIKSGLVKNKNLQKKQRAIFLDRDGTINVYKGFIRNSDEIELIDGVAEAIGEINKSGYLAIIVTNQPVIARGECTFEEVERMNDKIETLLGEKGVYIDDIFYCPHHTDKGFEGERVELKFDCDCRKPKPGMLLQAAEKYNIDLSKSFMIGDSMRDVEAGNNAGCISILLGEAEGVLCKESLIEAVDYIINEYREAVLSPELMENKLRLVMVDRMLKEKYNEINYLAIQPPADPSIAEINKVDLEWLLSEHEKADRLEAQLDKAKNGDDTMKEELEALRKEYLEIVNSHIWKIGSKVGRIIDVLKTPFSKR